MSRKHERAQITGLSVVGAGSARRVDFADHPIEIRAGDKVAVTLPVFAPAPHALPPAAPPPGAWWNNIARAWFVERDGEAVCLAPQPPPPPQDVREVFAGLGVPVIEARGAPPRRVVGEDAAARPASAVRVDL